jgi:catechol 2,3-dioxygenase-like lactoylglutathione lyase family enzyme
MIHKIQFINPIIFVKEIEESTKFYSKVLGLTIVEDAGPFVLFEGHFSIHQAREIIATTFGEHHTQSLELQGHDNLLLYFETEDIVGMFASIKDRINLIHPIKTMPWGQKVFRFYDPDRHIIEIGEMKESA